MTSTNQITSIARPRILGIITMVVSNAREKRNSLETEDYNDADFDE